MLKKTPVSIAARLPVPIERIERRIYLIRAAKRSCLIPIRRNQDRFPDDFMFQLSPYEAAALRSQTVILNQGRGRYSKYAPLAFTEHGVAMLAGVLNSQRAAQMSILIIRAFVKMRELLASHKDLAARVEKLEATQKKHGSIIGILAEEIDEMKRLPEPPKRRIGFKTNP